MQPRYAVLSIFCLSTLAARADTFNFSEAGFSGGGTVTGSFTGTEEASGTIALGDLSIFKVSFSGDSIITGVNKFSLKDDLFHFDYSELTGMLTFGVERKDGSLGIFTPSVLGYTGRVGPNSIATTGSVSLSPVITRAAVATTPEPSSIVLLGTGLIGMFGAARRKFQMN